MFYNLKLTNHAPRTLVLSALLLSTFSTFSHVVLEEPVALAGSSYKAALRVGHGCEGSPTTAITVQLPSGFLGAKPQPKPGWLLSVKRESLAQPYLSHGKQVTQDVTEITWTAATKDSWLPDAFFDEFVLRGNLPAKAQAMWFKVLQTCEKGRLDWNQIPSSGVSTRGLKSPAALLELIASDHVGHQH